jgi:hypothetical protein
MRVKKNDTSRTLNKEVLITNFEPPQEESEEVKAGQLQLLEGDYLYGNSAS